VLHFGVETANDINGLQAPSPRLLFNSGLSYRAVVTLFDVARMDVPVDAESRPLKTRALVAAMTGSFAVETTSLK
jgi:hypothetical protein